MYEQILYDVTDPMATIKLNRPEALNAWTNRMGAEVKHAVAAAEADKRVVAIVITGAGRGFCAGADLKGLQDISAGGELDAVPAELADASPGDPEADEDFRGTYTYLLSVRKPVIAAINGPIAGMAVPIALACDIRFASDTALFTTAFSRRGLVAEWGLAWLLPRLVGPAHALDLLFSARRVDAEEAYRLGLGQPRAAVRLTHELCLRVRRRLGSELLTGVDDDNETAGLRAAKRTARAGGTRRDPTDDRKLQAAGFSRRGNVVRRKARPQIRPGLVPAKTRATLFEKS